MKIEEASKYNLNSIIIELMKSDFESLTTVQIESLKAGLCNGVSLIITAPTSSGKTTIAEIAAVEGALKSKRSVYLVTHKALAEEKFQSFKAKYCQKNNKWFDVSISTGDYSEGDWHNGILIATYEKYLSLLSTSKSYFLSDKIVIADEIQILSDTSRGPDIEILCSIIKDQKPFQFVALSATAPNAKEIADWFECKFVNVHERDVKLREEIWYNEKCYYKYYGYEDKFEEELTSSIQGTLDVVNLLLSRKMGPILVFTITKRVAVQLAETLSRSRMQDVNSYVLSEQLDLFSEPTTLSRKLKSISERKIAFHSADLSFSERIVVERALRNKSLDVIFSTPTLASGVNFPIRTVIFDSFNRFWLSGNPWLPKSEYLNMAGRAGRLGLHDEGTSILLPQNNIEFHIAKEYLSPSQPPIESALMQKSIRK